MIKLIKKQGKKTYKNKEGQDCHFYNYYLQLENGKRIQIKAAFDEDFVILDAICEYVR